MESRLDDERFNPHNVVLRPIGETCEAIMVQLVRDLMFKKRTGELRSIYEVVQLISRKYVPQASPLDIRATVAKIWYDWIDHMVNVSVHMDAKNFKVLCPNWDEVELYYDQYYGHDGFPTKHLNRKERRKAEAEFIKAVKEDENA